MFGRHPGLHFGLGGGVGHVGVLHTKKITIMVFMKFCGGFFGVKRHVYLSVVMPVMTELFNFFP